MRKITCLVCDKEAQWNIYKNEPVCKDCIKEAQHLRDHLNRTRKDKFNEPPVTVVEIITRALAQKLEQIVEDKNNETV